MLASTALAMVLALRLAAPALAEAQAGRVWRIGYLNAGVTQPGHPGIAAFRQRLGELGYVEGQNVAFEFRSAGGGQERIPDLAAELVRLKVDVIVTSGRGTHVAAQKATTSIPIVMVIAADPLADGVVASLATPPAT